MRDTNAKQSGLHLFALSGLILAASGCSKPLQVDSDFPRPVVASLPINIGVYYDDLLRKYMYEKKASANSMAWKIEIGPAHIKLFDQLFQSIFENSVYVENLDAGSADTRLSVVLKPSIEGYTLNTPTNEEDDFYEVEISYNLSFYSSSGDFINQWSYTGQGKSHPMMLSADKPVHKATVAAMRDAAAWLLLELTKQADFETLIQTQQSDSSNNPENNDS